MIRTVFGKLKLSRFLENGNPKVSTYRTPGIMVASPKVRARKPWVLMIDDDVLHAIRLLHYRQGKSKKWIAQEFGLSRNTVAKYLEQADPPAYTIRQPRAKPVADKWGEHVRLILAEDQDAPRKQKHTAKRIFDRLVSEHGYTGSERTIRNLVASLRQNSSSRSFVPLVFEPGKDAQVDFAKHTSILMACALSCTASKCAHIRHDAYI